MKAAPIYNLRNWRLRFADSHRLVYRPTLRTALIRTLITLVCGLLAGAVWLGTEGFRKVSETPSATSDSERADIARAERELLEQVRSTMGEEEYQKLVATANARHTEAEAQLINSINRHNQIAETVTLVVQMVCGALIALGVLAVVACLWERVTFEKGATGRITVLKWHFIPRRRDWEAGSFARITTWAMERYWFGRHGRTVNHAWEWIVQLSPPGLPSMPIVADAAILTQSIGPQFLIHREKDQPTGIGREPEPVRELVKALRTLTGLPADAPRTVEAELVRGFFRDRVRRRNTESASIPLEGSTETHTFRRLEEIPPELRERMIELLRSGNVTQHADGSIEATGETVVERTLEEARIDANWESIPLEIREQIKHMRKKGR